MSLGHRGIPSLPPERASKASGHGGIQIELGHLEHNVVVREVVGECPERVHFPAPSDDQIEVIRPDTARPEEPQYATREHTGDPLSPRREGCDRDEAVVLAEGEAMELAILRAVAAPCGEPFPGLKGWRR